MCQENMGRQTILDLCVKAHSVADMGQVRFFRLHQIYKIKCFGQIKMRGMRLFTQCIDDQYFQVFKLADFGFVDGLHIGQVRKIIYPETKSLQFSVQYIDWDNRFTADLKSGIILNFDRFDRWRPGIFVEGFKNIIKTLLKIIDDAFVGINRNIALPEIKRADVIYAGGMVCMFMRK